MRQDKKDRGVVNENKAPGKVEGMVNGDRRRGKVNEQQG